MCKCAHLGNPEMDKVKTCALFKHMQGFQSHTSGRASKAMPTGTSSSSYFPDLAMLFKLISKPLSIEYCQFARLTITSTVSYTFKTTLFSSTIGTELICFSTNIFIT
jgi:hypothetical protein